MRIVRAIDVFLEQMRVEHDWTPRTIDSVYRCLIKLADDQPEITLGDFDGRPGLERVRAHLGKQYGRSSSNTRATRISYFHRFFSWAETEGYIDDDHVRKIERPPKRKPDVYRPDDTEIALVLMHATTRELAPLLLMSGAGIRASELCSLTWRDVDLTRSRVRLQRKGHNWTYLPLDPLVVDRLRAVYSDLAPDPADYVFTAETEQWINQEHRVRRLIDPKTPRAPKTLWSMVQRVSKRAGVRPLGPHALRHGFANAFLRATRAKFGVADKDTLQFLMGHSRPDTTQQYLDELEAQDAAGVLERLRAEPVSQSHGLPDDGDEEPANPRMEAAGIEPASAPADRPAAGGTEPDPPRLGDKRRRPRQQGEPNA